MVPAATLGCDGYAKAVVEAGAKTNLCIPGADTAGKKPIAAVMGVEAEEVLPMTRRGLLPRRLRPHP